MIVEMLPSSLSALLCVIMRCVRLLGMLRSCRSFRIGWIVFFLVFAAVDVQAARCEPPHRSVGTTEPTDLGRVIARLPASIEFVLAMDDGSTLFSQLDDSPVIDSLVALPRAQRVLDAWSALADELDMDDRQAFDELLGRRVVFVASGLQSGDAIHWALLSELDQTTERRFRRDFGARPRHIIDGQPVLELENGSFFLATSPGQLRCPVNAAMPKPVGGSRAVMLLAPADDRAFFAAMLPLLRCQRAPAPLVDTPGGRAIATMSTGQLAFLWRLPDSARAPDRYIAGSLEPGSSSGWTLSLRAGRPNDWLPSLQPALLKPWSPTQLQQLPPDPVLAVMGLRQFVSQLRSWAAPQLSLPLLATDDASLEPLLGQQAMLAIWLAQTTHDAHAQGSSSATTHEHPVPEVLYAMQTTDVDAMAKQGDAIISQQLESLTRSTTSTDAPAFSGDDPSPGRLLFRSSPDPSFVRSIHLSPLDLSFDATALPSESHLLSPGSSALANQSTTPQDTNAAARSQINWMYLPNNTGTASGEGWWILHYQSDAADVSFGESTAQARERSSDAEPVANRFFMLNNPKRFLHVGIASPAKLATLFDVKATPSAGSSSNVLWSLGQHISRLQWSIWIEPDDSCIDATIELWFADQVAGQH